MTTVLPLRPLARAAAAAALAGGLLLAGALPAGAHVHVEADDATAGGFAVLTFRVPNESDTAGTVAVEATLPNDNPFLSVSSRPVPGWTVSTTEADAAEAGRGGGHHRSPRPSGPSPGRPTRAARSGPASSRSSNCPSVRCRRAGQIAIPVAQTYSDGKVVDLEPADPGLRRRAGESGADVHRRRGRGGRPRHGQRLTERDRHPRRTAGQPAPAAQAAASGGSDPLARVLGGLGLAAGVGALVVALVGRRRGAA